MNKKPTKINLTSDDSLFEKSLNLQKYIEDLSSQSINLSDKFSFTWAGKSSAIKSVLIPSKLTLNPKPEESIKWDESENLFIEGDNLEVLKLLQKAYFEKVKMIYIDPPYNTGHDFVYNDNFSSPLDNYLKQTGQKNEDGESITTNKETNGRYHSDWLSMMYPRLKLAWNLLSEDGVIFASIDDNEVHHLRMVMDEIFGEENFIGQFVVNSTPNARDYGHIGKMHEYIVFYSKNNEEAQTEMLLDEERTFKYKDQLGEFNIHPLYNSNVAFGPHNRKNLYYPFYVNPNKNKNDDFFEISLDKRDGFIEVYPPISQKGDAQFVWRWGKDKSLKNLNKEIVGYKVDSDFRIVQKMRGTEKIIRSLLLEKKYSSRQGTAEIEKIFGKKIFSFPKPVSLIQDLIRVGTDTDSLVLDFFSGSGATAHAILKQNQEDGGSRKFICIQLPEKLNETSEGFKAGYKTISDIAKERIRRVINGYGDNPQPINFGFKVFALGESNYPENAFVFNPEKSSEENQRAFITYLDKAKQSQLFDKENDISIIYENIVKEGLSLNSKVEKISICKNNVYQVTDGEQQLLICLENKLEPETVNKLTSKSHKDKLFICLERALDDTMAANLALNLDLKTI